MTVRPIQDNFNAGEFGARMAARVQFNKYANAGSTYQNILPLPQGGFTFRPGFRYVAPAKSASVRPWLIPFVYSNTQSYVLEMGEQAMRFFKDQGQVSAGNTDAAIANGTFNSDISGWTTRSSGTGAVAYSSGRMRLTGNGSGNEARAYQAVTVSSGLNVEHVLAFTVGGDPGDTLIVRIGSSIGGSQYISGVRRDAGVHTVAFTPTSSPFYIEFECDDTKACYLDTVSLIDNTIVELATPWAASNLPDLGYAQSADVVYFCQGGSVRPRRLERYGHSSWSLVTVLFEDGPYLDDNSTTTTLTPSAVSGNGVTITASATKGINDDNGFRATDVGRLLRFKDAGGTWRWMQIVGYTSTTVVTADVKSDALSATTASTHWRLGKWNDTDGWPSVVGFIQQRLGFACTTAYPQSFWLSKSADIETFADEEPNGDVLDDNAIDYRFAALRVNTIRWLAVRKVPVIGTQGGQWTLSSQGATLTPTDISANFEVTTGCAKLQPIDVRSRLLFIQGQKRKIYEFADTLTATYTQGYNALDLTLLNDRVLTSGAVQGAYQQEPDSVVWIPRTDGQIASLTYQPDQSVLGWARQIHGGVYLGGDAVVESVACIPGQNGTGQFKDSAGRDEVWIAVKMTVNGATVRYIEVLEKVYNGDEDLQQDAFYVDSGLTLNSPITITAITRANPGVVTAAAHGLVNGDLVRIVRVGGMTEVNGLAFKVANKTTDTFELTDEDGVNVNTTSYTAYASGGELRKMVSTVTGLSHLEGQTVQVFADGAIQTEKTVTSGAITLDEPAGLVHVGLGYTRIWRSLKLAFGAQQQNGTTVGAPKNISDITLVLLEAGEGSLSTATEDSDGEGAYTPLDLREATAIDGLPVPFYTGEIPLGVAATYDTDIRLIIKGNQPSPATVLAIVPEVAT